MFVEPRLAQLCRQHHADEVRGPGDTDLYGLGMTRRRGVRPTPLDHVVEGEWPRARVDCFEAAVAQEVARRLQAARGLRPWRELGDDLDMTFSTLAAVSRGKRWIDSVTLARLERGLGVALWPTVDEMGQLDVADG